jgi:hypothetical protein
METGEVGHPQASGVSAILANVFASLRRLSLCSSVEMTARSRDSDRSAGTQMILDDALIAYCVRQNSRESMAKWRSSSVGRGPPPPPRSMMTIENF